MKVFISHSSTDKRFIRTLKSGLKENSIETWLDEDQLDFGDSLVEKLETALGESSHFVIILSPSSVDSDWVSFELKKALQHSRTGLMNKIIPIKYRECDIPEELSKLLYADLSDEVVLPMEDEVKFVSDGYDAFFLKLVRAIKNSSKALSDQEKEEIKKSIKSTEKEVKEHIKSVHRGVFKLIGYNTKEVRDKFEKTIRQKNKDLKDEDEIRPILLPPSIKRIYNPKIGEVIKIDGELWFNGTGHFAGFRNDDLAITIDKRVRDAAEIKAGAYYEIEINGEEKIVKFFDEIKTTTNKH